jgi:hypothetical protein
MTQDSLARGLSAGDDLSDDPIYDALVATLRATPRGRAFLDEYARRARAADTAAALKALARIETMLSRELGVAPADTPAAEEDEPEMTEAETPRLKSADLLAQVMALSPEERIALFS